MKKEKIAKIAIFTTAFAIAASGITYTILKNKTIANYNMDGTKVKEITIEDKRSIVSKYIDSFFKITSVHDLFTL